MVIAPSKQGVGMTARAVYRGAAKPHAYQQPAAGALPDEPMANVEDDDGPRVVPLGSVTPVWTAQFNGPVTDAAARALAVSGIESTGTWSRAIEGGIAEGAAAGSVELAAESAETAVERLQTVLAPHGTYSDIVADTLWADSA